MTEKNVFTMDRRHFIKNTAIGAAFLPTFGMSPLLAKKNKKNVKIALIKTSSRAAGVREALRILNVTPLKNKRVFIKPNFTFPFYKPGVTTPPDLIRALVEVLVRIVDELVVTTGFASVSATLPLQPGVGIARAREYLVGRV